MRFSTVRLKTGLRLHCCESGSARGAPVVFLHGWPDSWFSFSRVLARLPPTLRAIAFDQRGFGDSDHPDSGYTFPQFAADAVRELPNPIPEPFAREFQASTAYRPLPPELFVRIVTESLKIPARLWPVMVDALATHDATADLDKLRAPTLVLWGDHDALFTRAEQDRFLDAVPAARFKVYEETGHCPNWERPEDVATDIAAFAATAA